MIRHNTGYWIHKGRWAHQDADVISEVVSGDCYKLWRIPAGAVFVDVGAHIGCCSMEYHRRHPDAKVACVEVAPENIPVLKANVGSFAAVYHAACTYTGGRLLNSFLPEGSATGGSRVVAGELPAEQWCTWGHLYREDVLPATITLEQIADEIGPIDVLKLDCEGSEVDILRHSTAARGCRCIFGEYHGQAAWDELRDEMFQGWHYENPHRENDLGIFILTR